MNTFEEKDTFI